MCFLGNWIATDQSYVSRSLPKDAVGPIIGLNPNELPLKGEWAK